MTRRIVRRDLVREDLISHFVYIAQDNLDAADRFLEHTESAFLRLADLPFIGASRMDDFPFLPDLRTWPVPGFENYLIFYRPIDEGIEVFRVLHGARDLGMALGEENP